MYDILMDYKSNTYRTHMPISGGEQHQRRTRAGQKIIKPEFHCNLKFEVCNNLRLGARWRSGDARRADHDDYV